MWRDVCDYGWWMKQHSKTPAEVDAMPAWFEARYPQFAQVWDDVTSERRG